MRIDAHGRDARVPRDPAETVKEDARDAPAPAAPGDGDAVDGGVGRRILPCAVGDDAVGGVVAKAERGGRAGSAGLVREHPELGQRAVPRKLPRAGGVGLPLVDPACSETFPPFGDHAVNGGHVGRARAAELICHRHR